MADLIERFRKLQVDAGIPHMPTELTYECRMAVSGEGPRAFDWSDKPHRLVYDLSREVERLTARMRELEEALRPFVIGSAELEHLLWGHLPDDAPGTTTTKLGDYRRARKALGGSNE